MNLGDTIFAIVIAAAVTFVAYVLYAADAEWDEQRVRCEAASGVLIIPHSHPAVCVQGVSMERL